MLFTTPHARRLGRADHPNKTENRHRAEFARQMVFDVFGRHGRALDYDDFEDKKPWQLRAARLL